MIHRPLRDALPTLFSDLLRFSRQRFPLTVAIPLTLILYGGPALNRGAGAEDVLVCSIAVLAALFALRIADDLNSMEDDRLRKPDRGLCNGTISEKNLRLLLPPLVSLTPLVAYSHRALVALILPISACFFYYAYFRWKKRLPVLVRPFCSNFFFFVLPFAGTMTAGYREMALGAFLWLGAAGHEFAHNIRARQEREVDAGLDYVDVLGPRGVVIFSGGLYLLSALNGVSYILMAGRSATFLWCLLMTGIWMTLLFFRAWRTPSANNSRPFYIAGFGFFVLPLAGLLAEFFLRQIQSP